ncbi:hypothetical protein OQA88_12625 [Cercophora sp. LCS_1]
MEPRRPDRWSLRNRTPEPNLLHRNPAEELGPWQLHGGLAEWKNRIVCTMHPNKDPCFNNVIDVVEQFEYKKNKHVSFCQALARHVNEALVSGCGEHGCMDNTLQAKTANNLTGLGLS